MLRVTGSRELQAAIYASRQARRDIRLNINKRARTRARPLWTGAINARVRTPAERRVIGAGARVAASDRGVTLYAANSSRPLSGGLVPKFEWAGYEYGARNRRIEVTQRSRRGRSYRRPLTINRQFRGRQAEGQIAMDAASEVGTRIVALWVLSTVETLAEIDGTEVVP